MSFWRDGGKVNLEGSNFSKVQSFQERMLSDNLQRPEAGPAGVSWLESGSGNLSKYVHEDAKRLYFQPGTAVL